MLSYFNHSGIDKSRWNQLVESSENANVFCFSWYLDECCKWDAIILNDYKGAIALPLKSVYGFKQLYQAAFIQQCIWFGEKLTPKELDKLHKLLNSYFSDIQFNTNLYFTNREPKIRPNLIVELKHSSEKIFDGFSKSLRKNLRKVDAVHLKYKEISSAEFSVKLYKQAHGELNPSIGNQHYQAFLNLASKAMATNKAKSYIAYKDTGSEEDIYAAITLMTSHQRLHYVLGAPSEAGKQCNALSFLIWKIMEQNAEQNVMFDFEGSSIPSVADFYKSFGAKQEEFYEYSWTPHPIFKLLRLIYSRFSNSK